MFINTKNRIVASLKFRPKVEAIILNLEKESVWKHKDLVGKNLIGLPSALDRLVRTNKKANNMHNFQIE